MSSARIMIEVRRRLWIEACNESTGVFRQEKCMQLIKALSKRIEKRLINMSSDKRSVTTDALQTLGTIIDDSAGRDAIHLAVEPVIAGEDLLPGQDIGIVDGLATTKAEKKLGIVDPFVKVPIRQGQRFWFIVYPRTIRSLRHVWSHPDFAD